MKMHLEEMAVEKMVETELAVMMVAAVAVD